MDRDMHRKQTPHLRQGRAIVGLAVCIAVLAAVAVTVVATHRRPGWVASEPRAVALGRADRPTAPAAATTTTGTSTSAGAGTAGPQRDAPVSAAKPPPAPRVTSSEPLSGKVIAIDPGHDGGNFTDPSAINKLIFNGREDETCDTTGTETDGGFTEAQFNFDVAGYLASDLRKEGASVVLTRTTNTGVGPCVTERAAIGNEAHANAAISIHADGGPTSGRGFAILEPVADGPNNAIVGPSRVLGDDLRGALAATNVEPVSTYDGIDGIQPRDDLGGLNLSTVPKVLIECANMRNATDAALVVQASWQQSVAAALAAGISMFVAAT